MQSLIWSEAFIPGSPTWYIWEAPGFLQNGFLHMAAKKYQELNEVPLKKKKKLLNGVTSEEKDQVGNVSTTTGRKV